MGKQSIPSSSQDASFTRISQAKLGFHRSAARRYTAMVQLFRFLSRYLIMCESRNKALLIKEKKYIKEKSEREQVVLLDEVYFFAVALLCLSDAVCWSSLSAAIATRIKEKPDCSLM